MKHLIKLSALIFFIFISCKEANSTKEKIEEAVPLNHTQEETTTDLCIDSGYQIYKETALMWENSWTSVHNPDGSNFETLNFSTDSILELKSKVKGTQGLRAYYALISNARIPSLVLVNIIGCEDQYKPTSAGDEKMVLVSDPDLGQYFAEPDSVSVYINKWKTFTDNQNLSVHSPVYAYNYGWDELSNTINILETSQISVSFGLRTLSADEYYEYHDEDPIETNKDSEDPELMGSVVYCNVIYGDNPVQEYFNFAKPCPRYCDPITALIIN